MCIIILSRNPMKLDRDLLERCWFRNGDGSGFAYVQGTRMVLVKEFSNQNKFIELFMKHRKIAAQEKSPMLLHFRIGTSGEKSVRNVHPFYINRGMVFAHNGVLPIKAQGFRSDTRTFCEAILKNIPTNALSSRGLLNLLDLYISPGNKFVFLGTNKGYSIVNEKAGVWDTEYDAWFSNGGYKSYVDTRPSDVRCVTTVIKPSDRSGYDDAMDAMGVGGTCTRQRGVVFGALMRDVEEMIGFDGGTEDGCPLMVSCSACDNPLLLTDGTTWMFSADDYLCEDCKNKWTELKKEVATLENVQ